jgi:hypothetical protein
MVVLLMCTLMTVCTFQPEGVLLSKAKVSKLGVVIGAVTLTFIKNQPNSAPENYIPWSLQAAFESQPEPIR